MYLYTTKTTLCTATLLPFHGNFLENLKSQMTLIINRFGSISHIQSQSVINELDFAPAC